MPESNGAKIEQGFKQNPSGPKELDVKASEQQTFIQHRIDVAKSQRNLPLRLFNNLNFDQDDQANRDSRNSYIRPKKNDEEVRISLGTVEKKMISVVNEILSLNLQPEVESWDEENKPVAELGDVMGNIIKRTNEQEDDDDLKFPMLWDLATRRILFVEEYQDERECIKKIKKKYDLEAGEIDYVTKSYKESKPRKRILDPRTILLGDPTMPNHLHNEQPFIVKYDRQHWRRVWSLFHNFKNWKYVKAGGCMPNLGWFNGEFDWRMYGTLGADDIEIVTYYSVPDDEYQIFLNGVPMLPPGCPLPFDFNGCYSIQAFVSREMEQDCAYGQLFSINAKVLAGLSDEMLRLIVRKWRQSVEPPTVVKGKKVLSRDIWNPGAMANGIAKEDIQTLMDSTGISQSEMQTFNMIAEKIEEEVGVSKLFQGNTDKRLTATQALEQMKQAIKAIGVLVIAWTKVVRVMSYLRIYNIIENNLDPVSINFKNGEVEKLYRFYSVEKTKLDNNTSGSMIIQMTDTDLTPAQQQQVYDYEEDQRKKGNYVRYKNLNVEKLREFRLNWYIVAVPTEKDSTALQKILFTDQLNQAQRIMELTGRRLVADTVINEFERLHKRKNMFEKAPPPMQPMQVGPDGKPIESVAKGNPMAEAAASMTNSPIAGQMEEMVSAGVKRPSINSAVGQV